MFYPGKMMKKESVKIGLALGFIVVLLVITINQEF
jgi:hypothetical protein